MGGVDRDVDLSGLAILLAEDEQGIAVPLADEIEASGGIVTVAGDGLDAARRLEESAYDVLITDVRMPGRVGSELLRSVVERRQDVTVILMTGWGTAEDAVGAMRLGAFDYIRKPFLNEELLLKLGQVRELRTLRRENARLRNALERAGRSGR